MNPDYINPDPIAGKLMQDRYINHIWTDINGVPSKITDLTSVHLDYIIKLLQKHPNKIINSYKAKDWLPIMLAEYAVRMNKVAQSTVKTLLVDDLKPFPVTWTQFGPIMVRPSEREYDEPPLVEYTETIHNKYHCVVELGLDGYRVGYVGVRENHPAYRQDASAISTFVLGGISHTTHQVATFRTSYTRMWYFAVRFNHEQDYPDVYALDKYKEYWEGTHAYGAIKDMLKQHDTAPGRLKGKGFFEVRTLDYVKEQLIQLILDLEQYENDKNNNATIKVAPF
ncbi:MAG: hypothetical protein WC179_07960 [Candidatus Cloacimonadaceae bacterium]